MSMQAAAAPREEEEAPPGSKASDGRPGDGREEEAARGAHREPRDYLGGAVCALGQLVLTNVVVAGNTAAYGGGLYSEAGIEVPRAHTRT